MDHFPSHGPACRTDHRLDRFTIGIWMVYALSLAAALFHHALWADEAQAWLIIRDSSPGRLLDDLAYESHPVLFYLINMPGAWLFGMPQAMQALNWVIMVSTVAIILLYGPFSRIERLLLPFGYFLFYEYGVKTRNYALGALLIVVACAMWPKRHSHPIRLAILLSLLANTHILFLLIALAFALVLAAERIRGGDAVRQARNGPAMLAGTLFGAAVVGAIVSVIPPADTGFGRGWFYWWSWQRALHTALSVTGLLGDGFGWLGPPMASAILLLVLLRSRKNPLAALFLVASHAALAAFFYVKYPGFIWHYGLYYLVMLAACWIDRRGDGSTRGCRDGLIPPWLLVPILATQCVLTMFVMRAEWRAPLSNGRAAARFISRHGWSGDPIAGTPDYAVETIAAYLPKSRIFYANGSRTGSFIRWNLARLTPIAPAQFLGEAAALGPDVTLVSNDALPQALLDRFGFRAVASIQGARHRSENYRIYRRSAGGDTGPASHASSGGAGTGPSS